MEDSNVAMELSDTDELEDMDYDSDATNVSEEFLADDDGGGTSEQSTADASAAANVITVDEISQEIRAPAEDAKRKCINLLELLLRSAESLEGSAPTDFRNLTQGLIEGTVQPDTFANEVKNYFRMTRVPNIRPLLQDMVPSVRMALRHGEVTTQNLRASLVLRSTSPNAAGPSTSDSHATASSSAAQEESEDEESTRDSIAESERREEETRSPVLGIGVERETEADTSSVEIVYEGSTSPASVDSRPPQAPSLEGGGELEAEALTESPEDLQVVDEVSSSPLPNEPQDLPGPSSMLPATEMQPSHQCTPKKTEQASQEPSSPESEDEGQICSICFEPWGNSGNHRLASLKCGHIFGSSCIERWLKGQGGKCPQCNSKATKKDIRVIYAKALKVLDTSEKDRALKELEKEREAKRKLELEHAQTKLKYELKRQLVVKLQEELMMLRNATAGASNMSSSQGISLSQGSASGLHKKMRLVMHSCLDILKDGGCRVMAYNEWLNMMVVSVPSQVSMFPGWGVKKINILDMKPERFIPIHQKQIRDMSFNPVKNDLLLSVGMDKLVKITNICSNSPVGSFSADSPLWSCCWNADQPNQFFVGTAMGSIIQYDSRNTTGPVRTFKVSGSGPVVSLCYIPYNASATFSTGGLLVARLQSCCFVEVKEDEIQDHALLLEGPFTSISVEKASRHILVSCRPSQKYPHARHLVCELQNVNVSGDVAVINNVVSANIIHTFQGGTTQKMLARSCIVANPLQAGSVVACASNESTQSTHVWELSHGSCLQQLKGTDVVIDILPVNSNQNAYLALLTDKSVRLYKWVDIL